MTFLQYAELNYYPGYARLANSHIVLIYQLQNYTKIPNFLPKAYVLMRSAFKAEYVCKWKVYKLIGFK